MSKDKNKSRDRRDALLRRAARKSGRDETRTLGILIHREGGMARSNPDLQRLERDGMIRFVRGSWGIGGRLSPKRFVGNFMSDYRIDPETERGGGIHGQVNVTRAVITEKGLERLSQLEGEPSRVRLMTRQAPTLDGRKYSAKLVRKGTGEGVI